MPYPVSSTAEQSQHDTLIPLAYYPVSQRKDYSEMWRIPYFWTLTPPIFATLSHVTPLAAAGINMGN
eukprot:2869275-Pyramimonas_sp.AAC.1